jgi:hypothetical protein
MNPKQTFLKINRNAIRKKTKKEVLSEFIAILFFALLAFAFKAYSTEFNEILFRGQVEKIHLQDKAVLSAFNSITDIRSEVNTYILHDLEAFGGYLDKICENVIGRSTFKLMIANMKVNCVKKNAGKPSKIYLLEDCGKKPNQVNRFELSEDTVYINPDLYGPDGYNKSIVCGVAQNMILEDKKLTLCDALFHELCHAYHKVSGKLLIAKAPALGYVYKKNLEIALWTNPAKLMDEELYNITGYFYIGSKLNFDPICCNMYDMYNSIRFGRPIVQRVFHTTFKGLENTIRSCIEHRKSFNAFYKIDEFLINLSDWTK